MNISTYNRVEPNTAVVAHYNIADNGCIFGYESIFTDGRGNSFDGID
jgi:hypothetical protein